MTGRKKNTRFASVMLFFAVAGFVLYLPVIDNTFLSDDYDSLYRICIEKRIIYREFLRPMIDISFYFNYFISGLSPGSYYIFNVVIHIINAVLLFRFTCSIPMFNDKDQFLFAFLSAFLFLIYPFHNESIVWLSGRLSSMACLFALLCLIWSKEKSGAGYLVLSIVSYLLGLLCYESIIVLPAIIIIMNWRKYQSAKKIIMNSAYWIGATSLYLLTRLLLSGEIAGDYGSRMTDNHIKEKVLNIGKVLGRLFLPPSENQFLLVGLTMLVIILLVAVHLYLVKKKTESDYSRYNYQSIVICMAVSLLIPFAFGVSTRTSEGDRILYFPSCFLCMLAAMLLLVFCKNIFTRWLVLTAVTIYSISFLELNNKHWIKASVSANAIMDTIKNNSSHGIVFINMPDEWEGAFVFRNGFKKALEINRIDTARIKVFNYLTRPDYLQTGKTIVPVIKDPSIIIFPGIRVTSLAPGEVDIGSEINNERLTVKKERNLIYYWNKEKLIRLF